MCGIPSPSLEAPGYCLGLLKLLQTPFLSSMLHHMTPQVADATNNAQVVILQHEASSAWLPRLAGNDGQRESLFTMHLEQNMCKDPFLADLDCDPTEVVRPLFSSTALQLRHYLIMTPSSCTPEIPSSPRCHGRGEFKAERQVRSS